MNGLRTETCGRVFFLGALLISGCPGSDGQQDAESYNNQGIAHTRMGQPDEAIADFTEAIRLKPKYAEAYNNRGFVYGRDKREFERAITDFTEAIRLKPKYAEAYKNRANAHMKKGEFVKAIADYTEAIRLKPEHANAYYNRASVYERDKGQFERSIADFTEVIRLKPKHADAYCSRGMVYSRSGEFAKAIADYTEAIRLEPKHVDAYSYRAWLWATCPDAEIRNGHKAVQSARRAAELTKWQDSNCLQALSAACAEEGSFDEAIRWLTKAMAMDNKNREVRSEMLRLFEQRKPYCTDPQS